MKRSLFIAILALALAIPASASALSCIQIPFTARVRSSQNVVVVEVGQKVTLNKKVHYRMKILRVLKNSVGFFKQGQRQFLYEQGEGWARVAFKPGQVVMLLFSGAPKPRMCHFPVIIK